MALALEAYGAKGYQVRAYQTRQGALRDAAKAIEKTHSPVLLMAWRGAHTWVMTGFRADADPAIFANATIRGTYILDPWYPTISSASGDRPTRPGPTRTRAEMVRNYLKWKRPEGHYPDAGRPVHRGRPDGRRQAGELTPIRGPAGRGRAPAAGPWR